MQQALRRLDIFPKFDSKFEQEARDKTPLGAVLSLSALVIIATLLVSEIRFFLSIENRHELFVDPTAVDEKLAIHVNITFSAIPCDLITVDAVDSFGEFQRDIDSVVRKHRIDRNGVNLGEADELSHSGKEVIVIQSPEDGGGPCLSCYGAELVPGQCCRTCDDVRNVYSARGWRFDIKDVAIVQCAKERLMALQRQEAHEGCNLAGHLLVRRVQGNIHFIPGKIFEHLGMHLHDIASDDARHLNLSHTIHTLAFGQEFPGWVNPLDGHFSGEAGETHRTVVAPDAASVPREVTSNGDATSNRNQGADKGKTQPNGNNGPSTSSFGGGKFQYFIKVVPTRYEKLDGVSLESNQYSVTEHSSAGPRDGGANDPNYIPGVFLTYELSPIKVRVYEARPYESIAHFVLQLCAIAGGVFTVFGLVDAAMYHGAIHVQKKLRIGKFN